MASLLTLPALALSNPSTSTSGAARPRAAAFRCWALRRRGWAAAGAVASPNSVLSEHAFKRLQLGSDDEDDEEGAYGSDADEGLEGFQDDELVATLEKRRRAKEAGPAAVAAGGGGRAGHPAPSRSEPRPRPGRPRRRPQGKAEEAAAGGRIW